MTDLFKTPEGDSAPEQTPDPQDFLSELVGPGKKYADVAALAKGAWHQDKYIPRLEQENANHRSELQTRISVEEQIQRLQAVQPAAPVVNNNQDEPKTYSKEDLLAEVQTLLNQQKQTSVAERNVERVAQALQSAWGTNYQGRLKARAQELGLDQQFLANLAETKPDAFLNIVVPKTQAPHVTPPRPQVNSNSMPATTGERNEAYYAKLRKENPRLYLTREIQSQEHKDALRLGDRFFQKD